MHKYSEFRREMRRRKYRHAIEKAKRTAQFIIIVATATAAWWLYTTAYLIIL